MALATYGDLVDLFIQRASRIGLVDAVTERTDSAELEMYLFQALLAIVEAKDLNDFTIRNENIAKTQQGVDNYTLPHDYGRLIAGRVQQKRGMYLYDTAKDYDLEYIDPNIFVRQSNLPKERPKQFTVMRRQIFLVPPPDSNGANDYTLRGLYIERPNRPELKDTVPFAFPTILTDEAIFILAGDMNKMSDGIRTRRMEAMEKLKAIPSGG